MYVAMTAHYDYIRPVMIRIIVTEEQGGLGNETDWRELNVGYKKPCEVF